VGLIVVSGAPGSGKSSVAAAVGAGRAYPVISLDTVKESLADCLGLGDQDWSNQLGDAAAEVLFRLCPPRVNAVVEAWWRGERRQRAIREFAGALEIFCHCPGGLAAERMRWRLTGARHPIHRDMIDPSILDAPVPTTAPVEPLRLGGPLIVVDTSTEQGPAIALAEIHALLSTG